METQKRALSGLLRKKHLLNTLKMNNRLANIIKRPIGSSCDSIRMNQSETSQTTCSGSGAFSQAITKWCSGDQAVIERTSEFDRLAMILRKQDTIRTGNRINESLQNLMEIPGLSGKILLSTLCFALYPDFTILDNSGVPPDPYSAKLYKLSEKIIGAWKSILIGGTLDEQWRHVTRFISYVTLLPYYFESYRAHDSMKKEKELILRWYYLDKSKTDVYDNKNLTVKEKEELIDQIESDERKTIRMIKCFDKTFDTDELYAHKQLYDQIDQTMQCAWNDMLTESIETKTFDYLMTILQDIKLSLLTLCGKNKELVHDTYDIDFLKQQIDHNCFYLSDVLGLGNDTVKILEELHAPVRIKQMNDEWKSIVLELENDTNQSSSAKKCTKVIRFICNELNVLKDSVELYRGIINRR